VNVFQSVMTCTRLNTSNYYRENHLLLMQLICQVENFSTQKITAGTRVCSHILRSLDAKGLFSDSPFLHSSSLSQWIEITFKYALTDSKVATSCYRLRLLAVVLFLLISYSMMLIIGKHLQIHLYTCITVILTKKRQLCTYM
jgi:hypothetical protein